MIRRIFIVCPGAGKDARGFEAHAEDLFSGLSGDSAFQMTMVKGGKASGANELHVPCVGRKTRFARQLGKVLNRTPYVVQQLTFFLFFLPLLVWHRPGILYVADPPLYRYLFRWRKWTASRFVMIMHSGGNAVPMEMGPYDLLQLVTPMLSQTAMRRKIAQDHQVLIPHFLPPATKLRNKRDARQMLDLPLDAFIILSVGAIDKSVKRMDYVVREVSKVGGSIFLVMLGELELESEEIANLAKRSFPKDNFAIRRVERNEISPYYAAADVFARASLSEGFGITAIEALAYGLPVVVHDDPTNRWILEGHATYADLSQAGNLTPLIESVRLLRDDSDAREQRIHFAEDRYGWERLREDYRNLFLRALSKSPKEERG